VSVSAQTNYLYINGPLQMTATATTSTGAPQTPTCSWGDDAPNVASINPVTGQVTGLSSGYVTVWCDAAGHRATMLLRVMPSYAGNWSGSYFITNCSQSRIIAASGFCTNNFRINTVWPYNFILTQSAATVSGTFLLGAAQFDQTTATIATDGSLVFASRDNESAANVTAIWNINSLAFGRLTGTLHQTWLANAFPGVGELDGTIRDASKTSGLNRVSGRRSNNLNDLLQSVRGW
jgi:hypothetical protein